MSLETDAAISIITGIAAYTAFKTFRAFYDYLKETILYTGKVLKIGVGVGAALVIIYQLLLTL